MHITLDSRKEHLHTNSLNHHANYAIMLTGLNDIQFSDFFSALLEENWH